MKIENLTFCEALKYAYLGDRIWNTWDGERRSIVCDYWTDYWQEKPEISDMAQDPEIDLGFWALSDWTALPSDTASFPTMSIPGVLTIRCWVAQTTEHSV